MELRPPLQLCCAVIFLCFGLSDGFGSGAPLSTCWTRYPKHGGQSTQTTPCPISITVSPETYSPGENVTVTIAGSTNFTGFQIGAYRTAGLNERVHDHTADVVGQWTGLDRHLKVFTCFKGYKNMVTHSVNEPRKSSVLTWTAPNTNAGDLVFRATIVVDYSNFWTNESRVLPVDRSVPTPVSAPSEQVPSLGQLVAPVEFSGCGETKSCLYYPRHCRGDNCVAAVSFLYRPDTQDYAVEMFSDAAKNYVSLAFSSDKKMGQDETYTCVSQNQKMSLQHGWNPYYYNERLMLGSSMKDLEISHADGRLQCRFVIQSEGSVYQINQTAPRLDYKEQKYNYNQSWYVQLAWGKTMPESNVISYHKEMPVVSDGKIAVKIPAIHKGSSYHILVRAHVAVMVVAWIFLSGIVTVVARHYKNWLGEKRLCGTKIWFQVHRELAILVAVLTGIGLLLIFAKFDWEREIREKAIPHAYVGLAVTGAVGLQILAGMLRPGPESSLRPAFNWGHWFLGHASHVLAAATMFLAFDIEYITSDMRQFGYITLIVWVVVQVLCHLGFEIFARRHKNASFDVSGPKGNGFALDSTLLLVYIVVLAGLATAVALAFLLY